MTALSREKSKFARGGISWSVLHDSYPSCCFQSPVLYSVFVNLLSHGPSCIFLTFISAYSDNIWSMELNLPKRSVQATVHSLYWRCLFLFSFSTTGSRRCFSGIAKWMTSSCCCFLCCLILLNVPYWCLFNKPVVDFLEIDSTFQSLRLMRTFPFSIFVEGAHWRWQSASGLGIHITCTVGLIILSSIFYPLSSFMFIELRANWAVFFSIIESPFFYFLFTSFSFLLWTWCWLFDFIHFYYQFIQLNWPYPPVCPGLENNLCLMRCICFE